MSDVEAIQRLIDQQEAERQRTPAESTRVEFAKLNAAARERQGIERHGVAEWTKIKAKRAKQEKENAARRKAMQDRKIAEMKKEAQGIYLSEGGTETGFRDAWPKIYRQLLLERTVGGMGKDASSKGHVRLKM